MNELETLQNNLQKEVILNVAKAIFVGVPIMLEEEFAHEEVVRFCTLYPDTLAKTQPDMEMFGKMLVDRAVQVLFEEKADSIKLGTPIVERDEENRGYMLTVGYKLEQTESK